LDKEKPVSDLEATNHTPAGAQDEELSVANTSVNSKIKEMWTLDENGNKLDKIDVSANLLTMDYESASPEQRHLIDQAKWRYAIHQWERANDFSFSSNPTTPEDKKKYNEMLVKMTNDGIGIDVRCCWLSSAQRNTIEDALNKGGQLLAMKLKADASGNKTQGELSMSVLDAQGNALAKDQIRLTAGGKSVTTSVDTIKDLDYSQIYSFITTGVLPKQ
jgi:hypothetical protein